MKATKNLTKVLSALLCAAMIGSLSGCGSGTSGSSNTGNRQKAATQQSGMQQSGTPQTSTVENAEGTNNSGETTKDEAAVSDGSFQIGDVVDKDTILNYMESASESAVLYAVKRGEEFQIAYFKDDEKGLEQTLLGESLSDVNSFLVNETKITQISASQDEELVYFGNGSPFLYGVTAYRYAAPFFLSNYQNNKEEVATELRAVDLNSYRVKYHYQNNLIEGPDSFDEFHGWTITEINQTPIDDDSIQIHLYEVPGYKASYALVSDEETLVFGGYDKTTFKEAELKCDYLVVEEGEGFSFVDTQTRTKEGYTIMTSGSELKELGDYAAFLWGGYCLIQVVD